MLNGKAGHGASRIRGMAHRTDAGHELHDLLFLVPAEPTHATKGAPILLLNIWCNPVCTRGCEDDALLVTNKSDP